MASDFARLRPVLSDQFFILAERITEQYGFELIFASDLLPIAEEAETVFIFAGAHGKNLLAQAAHLPEKTKVIFYLGGMHSFQNLKEKLSPAMDRADYIFSGCKEWFIRLWPEHAEKFQFLPNFFAPHKRYSGLRMKKKPQMKCLLTGHTGQGTYPFRHFIRNVVRDVPRWHHTVSVMRHPRWQGKDTNGLEPWELEPELNDSYARTINNYFCTIATASRFKYALAKVAEIPAAGSLLLAESVPDMDAMGFQSWVTYVPITKQTVFENIADVLEDPEQFRNIRKNGREFARKCHSVENRVGQFGRILERING
jgi:hypothetical protein